MKSTPVHPAGGRLAGIEWMRGVAAFGVICIHSGLAVHNHTTPAAGALRDGFNFVVPFFLMVSFFFAIRAESAQSFSWRVWLERRARRFFIPFVFWSAVYLALHLAKLAAHHQPGEITRLLESPAALVLNGGTSVALYFLPLLFTGLVLIHLLSGVWKMCPSWGLVLGFIVALVLHDFCLDHFSDSTFAGLVTAPLQLALGLILDGVRCLAPLFIAGLLTRNLPPPGIRTAFPLLGAGLLPLILSHLIILPQCVSDSVLGLGSFLVAWFFSGLLAPSHWATRIGLFSFGVYLVHQVFLEAIQVFVPYPGTIGVIGTLFITTVVFAASMLTVGLTSRCCFFIRNIFGLT